jgi:capsular exopolysaccharide synthesis family protein
MTSQGRTLRKGASPSDSPTPFPDGIDPSLRDRAGPAAFEEIDAPATVPLGPFLTAALRTDSLIAEQFRVLGAKARALDAERPFRSIGLVSCLPGEGKTTMAIGLATALSREVGAQVLLVEADLRRPTIEEYLGLSRSSGLGEWLTGATSLVEFRRLGSPGFSLLPAGRHTPQRPELLHSPRMSQLLGAVRRFFDYVVLDCPPLTPIADSHLLQDFVDGFLLVVRARQASRDELLRSVAHLKPGSVRGIVFNDQRQILSGRQRYRYGYAYGQVSGNGRSGGRGGAADSDGE